MWVGWSGTPWGVNLAEWSSWLNLILKVSHQFTHTAGSSLCTFQSEQLSSRSKDSKLIPIINNQVKETHLVYFENNLIIHKFHTYWLTNNNTNKISIKKFVYSVWFMYSKVQKHLYPHESDFPPLRPLRHLKGKSCRHLYPVF